MINVFILKALKNKADIKYKSDNRGKRKQNLENVIVLIIYDLKQQFSEENSSQDLDF